MSLVRQIDRRDHLDDEMQFRDAMQDLDSKDQLRKCVLDEADLMVSTLKNELDHADQEPICPAWQIAIMNCAAVLLYCYIENRLSASRLYMCKVCARFGVGSVSGEAKPPVPFTGIPYVASSFDPAARVLFSLYLY